MTDDEKRRLRRFFDPFQTFMKSPTAQRWQQERETRSRSYDQLLSMDKILELTEGEIEQILGNLWANGWWRKKDYVIKRVLEHTAYNELKVYLRELLWGEGPLSRRYDNFRDRVKGLGPAALTEVLAFVHPEEYGIWNDRSRAALRLLGFDAILGKVVNKYYVSGAEYEKINAALSLIRDEMRSSGFPQADLLDVDFLLYYIVQEHPEGRREPEPLPSIEEEFDHDEAIEKLVNIGTGLGFEAKDEFTVAPGARVDVIWSAAIANLGVVRYVFEVQKRGNIDGLILNLQRAQNNPSVQKLIVVGTEDTLAKVRREASTLKEDFRRSLAYMDVRDVFQAAKLQEELAIILNRLELIKADFPAPIKPEAT